MFDSWKALIPHSPATTRGSGKRNGPSFRPILSADNYKASQASCKSSWGRKKGWNRVRIHICRGSNQKDGIWGSSLIKHDLHEMPYKTHPGRVNHHHLIPRTRSTEEPALRPACDGLQLHSKHKWKSYRVNLSNRVIAKKTNLNFLVAFFLLNAIFSFNSNRNPLRNDLAAKVPGI